MHGKNHRNSVQIFIDFRYKIAKIVYIFNQKGDSDSMDLLRMGLASIPTNLLYLNTITNVACKNTTNSKKENPSQTRKNMRVIRKKSSTNENLCFY